MHPFAAERMQTQTTPDSTQQREATQLIAQRWWGRITLQQGRTYAPSHTVEDRTTGGPMADRWEGRLVCQLGRQHRFSAPENINICRDCRSHCPTGVSSRRPAAIHITGLQTTWPRPTLELSAPAVSRRGHRWVACDNSFRSLRDTTVFQSEQPDRTIAHQLRVTSDEPNAPITAAGLRGKGLLGWCRPRGPWLDHRAWSGVFAPGRRGDL